MASTTALFTGLSGIVTHSRMLDVIGNNIANVNTTAFKSNRLLFSSTFSQTSGSGTGPSTLTGGRNPTQIGLGVNAAGTQRNFRSGSLAATGLTTNLAIEGDGFFVVEIAGEQQYTRNGTFVRNAENELVTVDGARVLGYAVDSNFQVTNTQVAPLAIPIGALTLAEATRTVQFTGNMNAAGTVAVLGSLTTTNAMDDLGGGAATAATLMTDIDDGGGLPIYAVGDIVRLSGAEKGGRTVPDAELTITATTTVGDLMTFLENTLGIDTSVGGDPGGLTIDGTGAITIESNYGTANGIKIEPSDFLHYDSGGIIQGQPITFSGTQEATGESIRTTFLVYDSLGTPLEIDLTMVLDSRDDTGTTWRYFAESSDSVSASPMLGTGTVAFDPNGRLIPPSEFTIAVDRTNTGALNPMSFSVALNSESGSVTALADSRSELAATFQDGSPIGTLTDFGIEEDGTLIGTFSNGLVRDIGQIAMARFTNPEGLVDVGGDKFLTGPNSGTPLITSPLKQGAGRVVSGALELSNVDLSQEFINMILASTGYSASSRVISTVNTLFQQLLLIGR